MFLVIICCKYSDYHCYVQVLPRHRQSAAAAAEAMLANPSPLSGLHKLALTICARKKGSATQPCAVLAGGAGAQGKENVTPAQQGQEGNASGTFAMLARMQLQLRCSQIMPVLWYTRCYC